MVPSNMDSLEWLRKHLEADGSDLPGEMVATFAVRLMAAEVDVSCNAGCGRGHAGADQQPHASGGRPSPPTACTARRVRRA
jgi:hypothetical protein